MKKIIITVIVLLILGLGAWYFWGYMSSPVVPVVEEEEILNEEVVQEEPGVKEFVVEGKNFSFTPSTITVKKGDTVSITLKNMGGTHDLKIDEYNVATKRTENGQEETVTFVADKIGSFEYYCSVGTHRAMGMKGMLVIEE